MRFAPKDAYWILLFFIVVLCFVNMVTHDFYTWIAGIILCVIGIIIGFINLVRLLV